MKVSGTATLVQPRLPAVLAALPPLPRLCFAGLALAASTHFHTCGLSDSRPRPAACRAAADGKIAAGLYVHQYLSQAVGTCTAAFARCMLAGQTQPGVWFPEEQGALGDRRALLGMASQGCTRFLLNRTPWQVGGRQPAVTGCARCLLLWCWCWTLGAALLSLRAALGCGRQCAELPCRALNACLSCAVWPCCSLRRIQCSWAWDSTFTEECEQTAGGLGVLPRSPALPARPLLPSLWWGPGVGCDSEFHFIDHTYVVIRLNHRWLGQQEWQETRARV